MGRVVSGPLGAGGASPLLLLGCLLAVAGAFAGALPSRRLRGVWLREAGASPLPLERLSTLTGVSPLRWLRVVRSREAGVSPPVEAGATPFPLERLSPLTGVPPGRWLRGVRLPEAGVSPSVMLGSAGLACSSEALEGRSEEPSGSRFSGLTQLWELCLPSERSVPGVGAAEAVDSGMSLDDPAWPVACTLEASLRMSLRGAPLAAVGGNAGLALAFRV